MGIAERSRRLTEAEYLAIEENAEIKSEFFDGEMFAMAGGSLEHGLIAANLARAIGNRLEGKDYAVYPSDVRIKVEATGLMTYPDLSVRCGTPQLAEGTRHTAINPTLLVEVLSDKTEAYDRGTKSIQYRQITSLRAYLLVSQKEPRIEEFVRQPDGNWTLIERRVLDSTLEVPSLGISIPLSEVFSKIKFRPAPFRLVSPEA